MVGKLSESEIVWQGSLQNSANLFPPFSGLFPLLPSSFPSTSVYIKKSSLCFCSWKLLSTPFNSDRIKHILRRRSEIGQIFVRVLSKSVEIFRSLPASIDCSALIFPSILWWSLSMLVKKKTFRFPFEEK